MAVNGRLARDEDREFLGALGGRGRWITGGRDGRPGLAGESGPRGPNNRLVIPRRGAHASFGVVSRPEPRICAAPSACARLEARRRPAVCTARRAAAWAMTLCCQSPRDDHAGLERDPLRAHPANPKPKARRHAPLGCPTPSPLRPNSTSLSSITTEVAIATPRSRPALPLHPPTAHQHHPTTDQATSPRRGNDRVPDLVTLCTARDAPPAPEALRRTTLSQPAVPTPRTHQGPAEPKAPSLELEPPKPPPSPASAPPPDPSHRASLRAAAATAAPAGRTGARRAPRWLRSRRGC